MHIRSIAVAAILLTSAACQRNTTVITGRVEGGKGKPLTIEKLNVNRTEVIDSLAIGRRGEFTSRLKPEGPELYVLKYAGGDIINLLLAPGERVHVETSADSFGMGYRVEGSEESERIKRLVEHMRQTRHTLDSLERAADTIDNPESPGMEGIRTAYGQAIVAQKRFNIRYIVEHMHSLSSVYALYQKYGENNLVLGDESDLQYFKVVADSLSVRYPDASLTQSLKADIERREQEIAGREQLNALLEMAGDEKGMLDLSIPDRDGNEIRLSSLKGHVILVVFWASGHQESIQALLRLQSTYERYHSRGFEVYAVSLDDNKIDWMKTIDYNEFDWINVSELSFPESRASLRYNVKSIPASFLINREGDIVARNLYGRTLETWLDNLL